MTERLQVRHARAGKFEVTRDEWFDKWWDEYGSRDLMKIYKVFGMEVFRRSACLYGFNKFIVDNNIRGKRCLEIGTLNALTSVILSRHFDEVVTIDIKEGEQRDRVLSYLGIGNVKCHVVGSNDEKGEIIDNLDFDCAYCDGDHAVDAEKDFRWVKRCGRVIFHEYWPLQPPVWELVNSLRNDGTVRTSGLYAVWEAA